MFASDGVKLSAGDLDLEKCQRRLDIRARRLRENVKAAFCDLSLIRRRHPEVAPERWKHFYRRLYLHFILIALKFRPRNFRHTFSQL